MTDTTTPPPAEPSKPAVPGVSLMTRLRGYFLAGVGLATGAPIAAVGRELIPRVLRPGFLFWKPCLSA